MYSTSFPLPSSSPASSLRCPAPPASSRQPDPSWHKRRVGTPSKPVSPAASASGSAASATLPGRFREPRLSRPLSAPPSRISRVSTRRVLRNEQHQRNGRRKHMSLVLGELSTTFQLSTSNIHSSSSSQPKNYGKVYTIAALTRHLVSKSRTSGTAPSSDATTLRLTHGAI